MKKKKEKEDDSKKYMWCADDDLILARQVYALMPYTAKRNQRKATWISVAELIAPKMGLDEPLSNISVKRRMDRLLNTARKKANLKRSQVSTK
jgi:hypothetical protein